MILALVLPLLATADAEYTRVDEVDGIVVEQRPVAGSKFVELRLTATTAKIPEALCVAAFGDGKLDPGDPEVKSRQVLEEGPDLRVTYDQVSAPVVSDRDYAVRARRTHLPNGACEVTFEIANDRAPPLKPGWIRIEKISGLWRFEPVGGHTQITYVLHTDPGGSLPSFVVEGSRRKAAVRKMKAILSSGG
jgi:hypothetical protein